MKRHALTPDALRVAKTRRRLSSRLTGWPRWVVSLSLSLSLGVMAASASPAGAPTGDAQSVARWAVRSGDHGQRPFLVVDKPGARVMVFDAQGRLQASAPALLGAAKGDVSAPGIGERKIADIRPHERTTPAGRFVAEPGVNAQGEDIVWIDYDAAVSMHRVRSAKASERRLERLASPTVDDNRISYGCINVPASFFDRHVKPTVTAGPSVVYVLPDSRPLREVFPQLGASVADAPARAGQPLSTAAGDAATAVR